MEFHFGTPASLAACVSIAPPGGGLPLLAAIHLVPSVPSADATAPATVRLVFTLLNDSAGTPGGDAFFHRYCDAVVEAVLQTSRRWRRARAGGGAGEGGAGAAS